MKKIIFAVVLFLSTTVLSFAQDLITKKDGSVFEAKVLEVEQSQIAFKKYSNLEGPTYRVDLADIKSIVYENGEIEEYNVSSEPEKKASLPQGMMTYNGWSGKVSVGGVTMEDDLLDKYFAESDLEVFNNGRTMMTVGGIVGVIGAIPFGWCVGAALAGGDVNSGVFITSTIAFLGGMIVSLCGESKVKEAVYNYNSVLAFQPKVHFGATHSGIGLALSF